MIIIDGPTGSGKTTTLKELETLGYKVIPTYTTRPIRAHDFGTIHVEPNEYNAVFKENKTFADFKINTAYGEYVWYLNTDDLKKAGNMSALVGSIKITPTLAVYANWVLREPLFKVFLNVDYKTILERTKDFINGDENAIKDRLRRFKKDDDELQGLKFNANFVVENRDMGIAPHVVADLIIENYQLFLKERSVYDEANARYHI